MQICTTNMSDEFPGSPGKVALKAIPDALTTSKGRRQQRPLKRDCLAGLSLSQTDGAGISARLTTFPLACQTLKLRTRYCQRPVPRETDPEISGLCTRNSPGSTVETHTCRGGGRAGSRGGQRWSGHSRGSAPPRAALPQDALQGCPTLKQGPRARPFSTPSPPVD